MAQGLKRVFIVPGSSNGGTAEKKILALCREVLSNNYPCCGASQMAPVVKNPPANAGDIRDAGSIPGLGRSPEGGHGHPLQYSSLENPQGQRCPVGYSPWGRKKLDMTEQLSTWHTHNPFYAPFIGIFVRIFAYSFFF